MRKQYHFRPSEDGLRAWDVDRLVRLVEQQPVEQVPLAVIAELDEDWWYRFGSEPTVRSVVEHVRLMDEADLRYPIILDPGGGVMDGMHRVAKALQLGMTSIDARRLATLPPPDFVGVDPSDLPYDKAPSTQP